MCRFLFLSLCFLLSAQQSGSGQARPTETHPAKSDAAVQVCREKIYSVLGPAPLISPEGIHVVIPQKEVEAALARGFRTDLETILKEIRAYDSKQPSPEQAIIAKLSDEELAALSSDIASCSIRHQHELSRDDLLHFGIAIAEIASAREYRSMAHLLVKNDEEHVEKYNALVAKYNELLAKCPH